MINEHTVSDIINFQFKDARQALHTANEVEITGFGKYVFLVRKAERELKRMKDLHTLLSGRERTSKIERQLQGISEEIEFLEFKLKSYEAFQSNNRRVEKSPDTAKGIEEENRDGVGSQDGDMPQLPA
jgi:hypothetical protein